MASESATRQSRELGPAATAEIKDGVRKSMPAMVTSFTSKASCKPASVNSAKS
jgi:hypothetical protein